MLCVNYNPYPCVKETETINIAFPPFTVQKHTKGPHPELMGNGHNGSRNIMKQSRVVGKDEHFNINKTSKAY